MTIRVRRSRSGSVPPPPPAYVVNLLAGGGAGLIETTATYPLDLAKTRLQMLKGTGGSVWVIHALRDVVKTEGEWAELLPYEDHHPLQL
jgi:hypothetical protein